MWSVDTRVHVYDVRASDLTIYHRLHPNKILSIYGILLSFEFNFAIGFFVFFGREDGRASACVCCAPPKHTTTIKAIAEISRAERTVIIRYELRTNGMYTHFKCLENYYIQFMAYESFCTEHSTDTHKHTARTRTHMAICSRLFHVI